VTPRTLRLLDAAAAALLVLWTGMALGFALLSAPVLFRFLPRDLAGSIVSVLLRRLDLAAWLAFGLAFVLAAGSRWVAEVPEEGPVGPTRLWTAAALAALLICFASTFIVSPRLHGIRAEHGAALETLPADHPDQRAFKRGHGLSRQFLLLRMLLALGLAGGIALLPRPGTALPDPR
jgi:hypothetical protein